MSSTVAAATASQQQPLVLSCSTDQDEPKTSSSIIDFLNQEQICWRANNLNLDDCASEVDNIEDIFNEINRLSGKIHESRSVEEILQEAETLILNQEPIHLKCMVEKWTVDSPDVISKEFAPPVPTVTRRTPIPYEEPKQQQEQVKCVPQSKSESHLSKVCLFFNSFKQFIPSTINLISKYNK